MWNSKKTTWALNIVGGLSVLGSYAYGLLTHPGQGEMLWGTIPENVRGPYSAMMLPAALGYFAMFSFLVTRPTGWLEKRFSGGLGRFNTIFATFLGSASLWMPLCWYGIDNEISWMVWPIRGVLLVTGVCTLLFLHTLVKSPCEESPRFRKAAILGATFLSIQCMLTDALIWPWFFQI